jgi:hypothetical protein
VILRIRVGSDSWIVDGDGECVCLGDSLIGGSL